MSDNSKLKPAVTSVKPERFALGEPEDNEIHVGAGGKLTVPREDFDVAIDEGTELDLAQLQKRNCANPSAVNGSMWIPNPN